MKQVLLDYPWSISDTLDGDASAWNVLQRFDKLVKSRELHAVGFLSDQQLDDFWRGPKRGSGSAWAAIGKIAGGLLSQGNNECEASPVHRVPELSAAWRRGLRNAMRHIDDWRNPQIIITESRRSTWPIQHEIDIQFEICAEEPVSGPYIRVLVELGEYSSHPYATSDFDPWDQKHIHPCQNTALEHASHPCILPKPPGLANVPLPGLSKELQGLRQQVGDKLYYLPPRDWRPTEVTKERWRKGHAFPFNNIEGHWCPVRCRIDSVG
jgi:hypothetical protein